jgi:hypothetical protein
MRRVEAEIGDLLCVVFAGLKNTRRAGNIQQVKRGVDMRGNRLFGFRAVNQPSALRPTLIWMRAT